MRKIDRELLPDEQILFRTGKHYIVFYVPLVWLLVVIAFLFIPNPFMIKFAIVPAMAALLTGINQWFIYYFSDFAVTNRRIIMKEGFFFQHTLEIRLSTVSNMSFNQSLIGRFLNYGTLIISPFGGREDFFQDIARPLEFQKYAQAQLDQIVR